MMILQYSSSHRICTQQHFNYQYVHETKTNLGEMKEIENFEK